MARVTPKKIVSMVSRHTGISLQDIRGKLRTDEICKARHAACYLIRLNYGREILLAKIYEIVYKREGQDHSTVINGLKSIQKRIDIDPEFYFQMAKIQEGIDAEKKIPRKSKQVQALVKPNKPVIKTSVPRVQGVSESEKILQKYLN